MTPSQATLFPEAAPLVSVDTSSWESAVPPARVKNVLVSWSSTVPVDVFVKSGADEVFCVDQDEDPNE